LLISLQFFQWGSGW